MNERTLLYVADPMCAWCWGFEPALRTIERGLRTDVDLRLVLGGLAPDSDEPMPAATRAYVQRAWDAVERATGARFDRRFWDECEPRRSTWNACRATLAAERLQPDSGLPMFRAIQHAYYLEARNPSLPEVLVELAGELTPPLDAGAFRAAVGSAAVQRALERDFALRDALGATGFPTLGLAEGDRLEVLAAGWFPAEEALPLLRARGLLAPAAEEAGS